MMKIKKNNLLSQIASSLLINVIKAYKKIISPLLPRSCRYYPTCSEYAKQAIQRHGPVKGMWLALKRVLRCNSLFPGGKDPVP